jgi:hypothetical protein
MVCTVSGEVVRAGDLRPGDRFPVGGVERTVVEVSDAGGGRVDIHYRPGVGLMGVRGGVQVHGVMR